MHEYNRQLGEFWIENNKDEKFEGTITIKKEEHTLTIINKKFDDTEDYILINGIIKGSTISFILINYPLNENTSNYKNNVICTRVYMLKYVFLDTHYLNKEKIKFKKISFKINNITSIIDLNRLDLNFSKNKEYPIKLKEPHNYSTSTKNYKLKINNDYDLESKLKGNGEEIIIKENNYFQIEYNEEKDITSLLKDLWKIRNLFNFLTGNSEIIEINQIQNEIKHSIILPEIIKECDNERDFYNPINLNKDNIEKVIKNWITKYDKLNSMYDLFFSIDEHNINPASLLLTYAQIIESYHRQVYDGKYITTDEFKSMEKNIQKYLKEMINEIEVNSEQEYKKEFKEKLFTSMHFSYEYSLKDRLIELFEDLNEYQFFKKILKRHSDKEDENEAIKEFSKIIKNNRNYYTHYDEKIKNKSLHEIELLELNDSLRNIIKLIFLKELEFSKEEINYYTENNRQFSFMSYLK